VVFDYVLYFFHVACLCAGSIAITLSFMLFARDRSTLVRFYLVFIISLFLLMVFLSINFFFRLTAKAGVATLYRVFLALFMLDLTFMVYFIPFFADWIVDLPWQRASHLSFLVLSLVYFILSLTFLFFLPNNVLAYSALVVIFTGMLIYTIARILGWRSRIKSGLAKNLCLGFCVLSAAFCPIIVVDACMAYARDSGPGEAVFGVWVFPIYFLWFNILALVYLIAYFVQLPRDGRGSVLRPDDLQRYKITEREAEIISLLREGLTHGEISQRLCISVHTVNNHVANIYSKVGARNRVNLLRILL
jgi:DNA-binding CsgD family transcriptional regulator